jgi:hypothetical protein
MTGFIANAVLLCCTFVGVQKHLNIVAPPTEVPELGTFEVPLRMVQLSITTCEATYIIITLPQHSIVIRVRCPGLLKFPTTVQGAWEQEKQEPKNPSRKNNE